MYDFDDLDDRSRELEDQVDEGDFEDLSDEELDELLEDAAGTDEDHNDDDGLSDVEADADTLRNVGWGTDEDYGYYGETDGWD